MIEFDIKLDDGRVACCWQAQEQEYQDMKISSGLVENIDPDNYYLRFEREGEEPTTIFIRQDEALAILYTLSGALWSKDIMELA